MVMTDIPDPKKNKKPNDEDEPVTLRDPEPPPADPMKPRPATPDANPIDPRVGQPW